VLGSIGGHAHKRLAHAASISELGGLEPAIDLDPIGIAGVDAVDRRDHFGQASVFAHPLHASWDARRAATGIARPDNAVIFVRASIVKVELLTGMPRIA
jgi:hypothetical protein